MYLAMYDTMSFPAQRIINNRQEFCPFGDMMKRIGFASNMVSYASVHRQESNSNDIIIVHQLKDINGAKDFAKALPPLMEKIGAIEPPEIWFSEDIEQVRYA